MKLEMEKIIRIFIVLLIASIGVTLLIVGGVGFAILGSAMVFTSLLLSYWLVNPVKQAVQAFQGLLKKSALFVKGTFALGVALAIATGFITFAFIQGLNGQAGYEWASPVWVGVIAFIGLVIGIACIYLGVAFTLNHKPTINKTKILTTAQKVFILWTYFLTGSITFIAGITLSALIIIELLATWVAGIAFFAVTIGIMLIMFGLIGSLTRKVKGVAIGLCIFAIGIVFAVLYLGWFIDIIAFFIVGLVGLTAGVIVVATSYRTSLNLTKTRDYSALVLGKVFLGGTIALIIGGVLAYFVISGSSWATNNVVASITFILIVMGFVIIVLAFVADEGILTRKFSAKV